MTGLSVTLPYGDSEFYGYLYPVFTGVGMDADYVGWLEKFVYAEGYNDYYDYESWYEDDWEGWDDYEDDWDWIDWLFSLQAVNISVAANPKKIFFILFMIKLI